MLGRVQSSSPSSENYTTVYDEEISVLERQRAIFERLYESQQHISCLPHQQNISQFNNLISEKNYPIKIDENSPLFFNMFDNNSVELACQSSFSTVSHSSVTRTSTKKRKTEFLDEDNCKAKRHEGETGEVKSEITVKSERGNLKDNSSEVKKTDYIHVRARRGQATDSHSLAERARREKISKKMKCLQDLVPGCNQVIGKAGMLDEIINYVQSLQKQVEFLSMKLATSNLNTSDHLFSTYMANFQNLASIQPCLQNNLVLLQQQQQQQEGSSVGRENCLMSSFPEAFLDSSRLPVGQQLQSFETDLQSLFGIRFQ